AQPEIEVVGATASGEEAVALAFASAPDVLAVDAETAGAVTTAERVRELLPDVRVIAFADGEDTAAETALRAAGATAVCAKTAPLAELEQAIAGASVPLLSLAHTLDASANRCPTSALVARELVELGGAAYAATYLAGDAAERRLALTLAEARCDALTGLGNRRAFDEHLERELSGLEGADRELTLVLLDLDGFKQTNDCEGHLAGDLVLREVGRVLLRVVR